MASTTPNIGLTLPTGAEKVSRQIINDNNTIIDGKMGAVPGGQNLQGEIDALNGKIDTMYELTSVVKTQFQTVPSSNRFIIWLYDSYVDSTNFHAYRIDFNGNAKTAKLESITSGGAPTTLLTFNVT